MDRSYSVHTTKAICYLVWRAKQYVLHYSSDPASVVNDVVQRVVVSVSPSVLSKTPTSMNAI